MSRLPLWLIWTATLAGLLVVCAGCCEFCNPNISHSVSLAAPVRLNQPATATITLDIRGDVPGVTAWLFQESQGHQSEVANWQLGDMKAGQRVSLTAPITFTRAGLYSIIAGVQTRKGSYNLESLYLYVDETGAVFDPTPVNYPGNIAPGPTSTLLATPSPTVLPVSRMKVAIEP